MQVWCEKTRLGVAFKVGVGPGVAAGAWHRVLPSLQPGKRPQATQARLSPAPAAYEQPSKAARRQHVVGNECALIWCSGLLLPGPSCGRALGQDCPKSMYRSSHVELPNLGIGTRHGETSCLGGLASAGRCLGPTTCLVHRLECPEAQHGPSGECSDYPCGWGECWANAKGVRS